MREKFFLKKFARAIPFSLLSGIKFWEKVIRIPITIKKRKDKKLFIKETITILL